MLVALDIETNGTDSIDVFKDKIVLTSVVIAENTTSTTREHLIEGNNYPDWLLAMLQDSSVMKIVHNAAFDIKFIQHNFGITAKNVWDTLSTERLLTAGKGFDCDLASVMLRRFGKKLNKDIRSNFGKDTIGEKEREYCLEDSRSLLPLYKQQLSEIKQNNQMTAAVIENCMGIVVADMELSGIGFDIDLWNKYVLEIQRRRDAIELDVTRRLGIPYTSGLFDDSIKPSIRLSQRDKILDVLSKNDIKLKNYTANDLQFYIHYCKDEEKKYIVSRILEFKKWDKALDWGYDEKIHPVTGRIHANFNPQGADSFRFTASEPNLQQVAKPFSDDINFRHLFRARSGYKFVGADYSQIELRLLADVTEDKDYITAFREGLDLHKMAAEKVLGRELQSKEERNLGKAINFGIIAYGGGPKALMRSAADYGIFLTEYQARKYVETIKSKNATIENWGKRVLDEMKRYGYIQTPIGHRRYLIGEDRETVARNTHIQPFAAGIMKDAIQNMFWIFKEDCEDTHIILQVHDEVLVECPEHEAERVRAIVVSEMKDAGNRWMRHVPVEVDSYISDTWEK